MADRSAARDAPMAEAEAEAEAEAGAAAGGCPFALRALEDRDPFPTFQARRGSDPVCWDASMNAWVVFDYDLCAHVEKNEVELFRTIYADADPILIELKGGPVNITIAQGDLHDRLRKLHFRLLTPAAVEGYRETIVVPIVRHLMARAEGKASAELVELIATEVPPRVILALFGMPWEDDVLAARVHHLHNRIMDSVAQAYAPGPELDRARVASAELNAMLLPYVRAAREADADNFIARIWREAPAAYGDLGEDDVVSICRELFLGGADTTVHGIANSLYLMLTRPELLETVRRERGKPLNNLVEEALRLFGSVQFRFRRANQDIELGGANIARDDLLILYHSAANRDEKRYECPDEARLDRSKPMDHLTFNVGPRSCLGMFLARAEIRVVLNEVLDRMPGIRLDPQAPAPEFIGLLMRSYRPLHVLFGQQPGDRSE